MDILKMFFEVFGGLGIFLLGMKNMSEGMQAVAGDRLRRLIGLVTSNRLLACGVGTAVTSIIQSSSITTVMVVGLVNAGIMTLHQAIGVIMGANIGTTMTAWLLTFQVDKYGLPILGLAALIFVFSKRDRIRFTAMFFLGLGMVFYGLELMKLGFAPLRQMPTFVAWFSRFEPDGYLGVIKCCLVGAVLTAIVQSSSATVGITMALAKSGIIHYHTAAALVLGENIGTTITAFLASLGASANARRAAYAHILFNLIGALWITAIFGLYTDGIIWFVKTFRGAENPDVAVYTEHSVEYPYTAIAIAATHSGFNILNTLVFMPLVGTLAAFLNWAVKERKTTETPRLTYLDVRLFDTPSIALEQSGVEVVKMAKRVSQMLDWLHDILDSGDLSSEKVEPIFQAETDLDVMQKEIVEFIGEVMAGNISHETMQTARAQLRIADELESISDYIANVTKLRLKMRDLNIPISPQARDELLTLHQKTAAYVAMISTAIENDDQTILSEAMSKGTAITKLMKEFRSRHLQRVSEGKASPHKSLIYTDMLNSYRRIKDHGFNIAEVLAGEK